MAAGRQAIPNVLLMLAHEDAMQSRMSRSARGVFLEGRIVPINSADWRASSIGRIRGLEDEPRLGLDEGLVFSDS
jgi:hypothetical protein